MNIVRGNTVCPCSQADSCRDPQYDTNWHPLEDTESEFLVLLLVLTSTISDQVAVLTRYQLRLPPPCAVPFLSSRAISAKNSSRLRSSGATYVDMSRKNAATGKASPISRPGAMYGAGEPSCQTQRNEMTAKEGRMNMIRMILELPSLSEKILECRNGVHTVSVPLDLRNDMHV